MKKLLIVAAVSGLAGFVGGTWWVASDIDEARVVAAAAKLMREDKVLSYMERNELAEAIRVQREFLRLSLDEVLAQHRKWPPEIQTILSRRASLVEHVDKR